MKTTARNLLPWLSAIVLVLLLVLVLLPVSAQAQDAAPAAVSQSTVASPATELPVAAQSVITGLVAKFPWLATVLTIYSMAAIGWQVLCAAAHNWAARTSNIQDDAWLAKLDTLWWFRALDKLFYFGGYLGAWAGGKKL